MLSEISQTEKGKYCITSLVCGISKKKKKKTHRKKIRHMFTRSRGLGKGELKEVGQKRYTLPKTSLVVRGLGFQLPIRALRPHTPQDSH